ncbi:MAG TPA: hypothetical protein VNN72_08295, partial [Polyangiaceae bacterium]|nr:hypothetical protein [Polyangiaceae bacterium]
TSDGQYPEPPPTSTYSALAAIQAWFQCAFDADGVAYCFGQDSSVSQQDQILRLALDRPVAEIVYSEATRPIVWMHGSNLISGP